MEMPEKIQEWLNKAKKIAHTGFLFGENFFKREYSRKGLVLLFLVALALGAFIKSFANNSLTMGFDDYKLSRSEKIVDLNRLQKELIQNGGTLATSEPAPRGEVCTEAGQ